MRVYLLMGGAQGGEPVTHERVSLGPSCNDAGGISNIGQAATMQGDFTALESSKQGSSRASRKQRFWHWQLNWQDKDLTAEIIQDFIIGFT